MLFYILDIVYSLSFIFLTGSITEPRFLNILIFSFMDHAFNVMSKNCTYRRILRICISMCLNVHKGTRRAPNLIKVWEICCGNRRMWAGERGILLSFYIVWVFNYMNKLVLKIEHGLWSQLSFKTGSTD